MTDNLYIWVVSEEQKVLYKTALGQRPYRQIIVRPEPELYKCYKYVADYFPEGQHILWLEDKIKMYKINTDKTIIKHDINLKSTVYEAFKTITEEGIGAFTFTGQTNFSPNYLYLKGKPIKEIGFFLALGSISGFILNKDLWSFDKHHKYQVDVILSLRYYHRYAGILKYNYIFYTAKFRKMSGGLSNVCEERKCIKDCNYILQTDEIKIYIKDIVFKDEYPTFTFKTNPQIKKITPLYKRRVWND